jgi:hypothetical protein
MVSSRMSNRFFSSMYSVSVRIPFLERRSKHLHHMIELAQIIQLTRISLAPLGKDEVIAGPDRRNDRPHPTRRPAAS